MKSGERNDASLNYNTLTEEMVMGAVKHWDGVSRCSWYMDLHDGQDKHPLEQYRAARRPPDGEEPRQPDHDGHEPHRHPPADRTSPVRDVS